MGRRFNETERAQLDAWIAEDDAEDDEDQDDDTDEGPEESEEDTDADAGDDADDDDDVVVIRGKRYRVEPAERPAKRAAKTVPGSAAPRKTAGPGKAVKRPVKATTGKAPAKRVPVKIPADPVPPRRLFHT